MITIIGGSRSIQSYPAIVSAIEFAPWIPTVVFSGMRPGPDVLGYRWAITRKIPVRSFKPDWGKQGKPADLIKCFEMAAFSHALISINDGTDHVADYQERIAKACGCRVHIVRIPKQQLTLVDYGRQLGSDTTVH